MAQDLTPGDWVKWGIGAAVFMLVMSAIMPEALDQWFNVSTEEWPGGVEAIWNLVVILILVAVAYLGWNAIEQRS